MATRHLAIGLVLGLACAGGGAVAAGQVTGANVKDYSLTQRDIASKTIKNRNMKPGSINGKTIKDGSLTGADVADGSLEGGRRRRLLRGADRRGRAGPQQRWRGRLADHRWRPRSLPDRLQPGHHAVRVDARPSARSRGHEPAVRPAPDCWPATIDTVRVNTGDRRRRPGQPADPRRGRLLALVLRVVRRDVGTTAGCCASSAPRLPTMTATGAMTAATTLMTTAAVVDHRRTTFQASTMSTRQVPIIQK